MAYRTRDYDRTSPPPQGGSQNSEGSTRQRLWNTEQPTITLDEMSISKDNPEASEDYNIEDVLSVKYPFIKINDYVFSEQEIDSITIDSREFLPTVTLRVTFLNDLFLSKELPKDGDIISVMIRNKSDLLKPIRNDYVITGTSQPMKSTMDKDAYSMTFFGELFVPGLKSYLGSSAIRGTSMEALKQMAKELELGFSTNETETFDSQIWYSTGPAIEFIQDTVSKAWKDEDSFFYSWIDVYYNLNFVNIQKELLASEEDIDLSAALNNVDNEYNYGIKTDETSSTAKVFSNFVGMRSTSNYITHWKPVNRSSALTFEYGTTINTSFYEQTGDPDAQKYWKFEVPPKYDEDKLENYIILRGRPTWNADVNTDQTARANYNYKDLYSRTPWLGIQYTIADAEADPGQWTGNHHPNYMRAQVHNFVNMIELAKLNVEIRVQGTNLNFIKGEKIPTVLIKTDPTEVKMAYPDRDQTEEIDFFYSGWYMIMGFKVEWARDEDNILSNFSQSFVLTRREWPTPEPVKGINNI